MLVKGDLARFGFDAPSFDERIPFPSSHEMVRDGLLVHQWNRNVDQTFGVLNLVPANTVHVSEQDVPHVHVGTAMLVQTRASEKVGTVGANIWSIHFTLDEGFREKR